MTRVTHVIDGLEVGGAEIMLRNLLRETDLDERPTTVISLTTKGTLGADIEGLGVEVRALGMSASVAAAPASVTLLRWIRASAPDVVQTWLYEADLLGGLASRLGRPGTPVIWGVHQSDLDPLRSKRHTRAIARVNARLSRRVPTRIVCCSSASARIHVGLGYDEGRIEVIPNGFDLEAFVPDPAARPSVRAELGVGADAALVGVIARYDPQKDHAGFLRAAATVAERHPRAHFVLCGTGVSSDSSSLTSLVGQLGLEGRVHLLGRRDDVGRIAASLDVAVSPSAYGEAFPLAVGEAMACGVPCVVTDVGDCAYLVGPTGSVVPPADPAALAAAVADLLDASPGRRQELGAEARARIRSHFRIDVVARRYRDLQDEVVVERRGRR